MSNHYHLACLSHGGESEDVGNRDAKPASLVVKNRENIVKAVELLRPLDIPVSDIGEAHWDGRVAHAMRFVAEHPECELELHNESCNVIAFQDEPDPHDGPDKFCPKCGGRIVSRSISSGNGGNLIDLDPVCINIEIDHKKERFVYWFLKGYRLDNPSQEIVHEHKDLPGFLEGFNIMLVGANPFTDEQARNKALQLYNQKLEREKKD